MRCPEDPLGTSVKQLPGYGLKTLIRPGTPGHLGPRRGSEGEGTIPTFSHWEKVAEGRMRAAPTRRLCPQIREVISRSFLGVFLRLGFCTWPIPARSFHAAKRRRAGRDRLLVPWLEC